MSLLPQNAELYDGLGRVLSSRQAQDPNSKPHVEAIQAFEQAVKLDPNTEYWTNLGHTHSLAGDLQKGKFCFEQALKIRPEDPKALGYLGGVYTKKEMYGTAGKLLLRALKGKDFLTHIVFSMLTM